MALEQRIVECTTETCRMYNQEQTELLDIRHTDNNEVSEWQCLYCDTAHDYRGWYVPDEDSSDHAYDTWRGLREEAGL